MTYSLKPANLLRDFEFFMVVVTTKSYLLKYYLMSNGKYVMPFRKILMTLT